MKGCFEFGSLICKRWSFPASRERACDRDVLGQLGARSRITIGTEGDRKRPNECRSRHESIQSTRDVLRRQCWKDEILHKRGWGGVDKGTSVIGYIGRAGIAPSKGKSTLLFTICIIKRYILLGCPDIEEPREEIHKPGRKRDLTKVLPDARFC